MAAPSPPSREDPAPPPMGAAAYAVAEGAASGTAAPAPPPIRAAAAELVGAANAACVTEFDAVPSDADASSEERLRGLFLLLR